MMSNHFLFLLLLFPFLANNIRQCQGESKKALDEFITYYEPIVFLTKETKLTPASNSLHSSPEELKKVAKEDIEIRAFGRTFLLELKRADKILAPDSEIRVLTGEGMCLSVNIDCESIAANLMEGRVIGEPESYVHGSFRGGIFTGVIYTRNQTFFIERASKYFPEKMPFDCVIFRQEDLNITAFDCGIGQDGVKCDPIRLLQRTGPSLERIKPILNDKDHKAEKTWFDKRIKKTTCKLKLVADHLFYEHAGQKSAENVIYDMIFHVREADRIFRATDFNDDGKPDNVGFRIHSMEVFTNSVCLENSAEAWFNLTSEQYLETFSERDFQNYCVGIAFSGYTFPGRVLGIAWMADADLNGYVGGICEPRLYSTLDQKSLSFNTAVITTMLEERRMPVGITAIAVAHELGHSFGSDHDPNQDSICSPSPSDGGKYIMSAFAVKGDQKNNRYFSPCSRRIMNTVVNNKGTCFTCLMAVDNSKAYDCEVKAMNIKGSFFEKETTVVENKVHTSLKEIQESSFGSAGDLPTNEDIKERKETNNECFATSSLCNSDTESWCPTPQKMPDGSSCLDGTGQCREGSCMVDPCILNGKKECECKDLEKACIVCCRADDNDECRPICHKEIPWWFLRRPGEPCNNGLGQCDFRGHCVVNPELRSLYNKVLADPKTQIILKPEEKYKDKKKEGIDTLPLYKKNLIFDKSSNWDWKRVDNNNLMNAAPNSWLKDQWMKKVLDELIWVCLGLLVFFVLLFCASFLCSIVAMGFWCLHQCTSWSRQSFNDDSIILIHQESQQGVNADVYFQSEEQVSIIGNLANPVRVNRSRSRTF